MIPGLIAYLIVGLFIARAEAEFLNQKYIKHNVLIAGEPANWSSNFWTWALVILTPLIWVGIPVILAASVIGREGNKLAVYVGRELSNPRDNLKEIENEAL